jgi:hypothetical protein
MQNHFAALLWLGHGVSVLGGRAGGG